MSRTKADLITHPMRARIMTAMMGRQLTTNQLAKLLPEAPLPSLYRHLRDLVEGGVIEVVDEVRVGGAANKVYAVAPGGGRIERKEVEDASPSDHLRYFATFVSGLEQTFRAYLESGGAAGEEDRIQCLMEPLYLNRSEYERFRGELDSLLARWRTLGPGDDRERLLFARVLLPDRPDPPRE